MAERLNVEDALRALEDSAALLRFLLDHVRPAGVPDASVYAGLGDACERIEETIRSVRHTLNADALSMTLREKNLAGQIWAEELADPAEDVYTLADGEPVTQPRTRTRRKRAVKRARSVSHR